jgi:putative FmdB family regulatory protein
MPIYAYKCSSCGHSQDVLQKMSATPLTDCPACGKPTYAKQITAPQFQLKGSGWYVTDFKGGASGGKDSKKDGEAESAKSDAKPATTDAKNETKSEPKNESGVVTPAQSTPAGAPASAPAPAKPSAAAAGE